MPANPELLARHEQRHPSRQFVGTDPNSGNTAFEGNGPRRQGPWRGFGTVIGGGGGRPDLRRDAGHGLSRHALDGGPGAPGSVRRAGPVEKVAFEVGLGVAFAGGRTLITMKPVGLDVAADAPFTATYAGVAGGTDEILAAIEAAGMNVEYMYAFTARRGDEAIIVFRFEDPDRALATLPQQQVNVIASVDLLA